MKNCLLKKIINIVIFLIIYIFISGAFFLTTDFRYVSNQYTSGSDDLQYFLGAQEMVTKYDLGEIDKVYEEIESYSGHAKGYPLILFIIFELITPKILVGIIINGFVLYILLMYIIKLSLSDIRINKLKNFILVAILSPSLFYASMHLYKDLLLTLLIVSSIYYFESKRIFIGSFVAAVSDLFRPFNFILILISFLFLRVSKKLLLAASIPVIYLIWVSWYDISDKIDLMNLVALRDMEDYGSSYSPGDNKLVNYLIGLVRYIFMPFPWSVPWSGRPIILSILEFYQTALLWISILLSLVNKKITKDFIRDYSTILAYVFFQASVYSIVYYGNSHLRYRLVLYCAVTIFILKCTNSKCKNSKCKN